MDTQRLSQEISTRRKSRKLTQEDLSSKASVSREYIVRLENGNVANVSVRVLEKLAVALECTPAQLTGESDQVTAIIPPSLSDFAREAKLDADIVLSLAKIEFCGARPQTVQEWRDLYKAVRKLRRSTK